MPILVLLLLWGCLTEVTTQEDKTSTTSKAEVSAKEPNLIPANPVPAKTPTETKSKDPNLIPSNPPQDLSNTDPKLRDKLGEPPKGEAPPSDKPPQESQDVPTTPPDDPSTEREEPPEGEAPPNQVKKPPSERKGDPPTGTPPQGNTKKEPDDKFATSEGPLPPEEITAEDVHGKSRCEAVPSSVFRYQNHKSISISGTTVYKGLVYPLLIEVVRPAKENSVVLYSLNCTMGAEWEISLPQDLGKVYLVLFSDVDGNGPTDDDPRGRSKQIVLQGEKIEGIRVEVKEKGELSPLVFPFVPEVPLEDL